MKYKYISVISTYQGKSKDGQLLNNSIVFGKEKGGIEYNEWFGNIFIEVLHIEELPKRMAEDDLYDYIEENSDKFFNYFNNKS